MADGDDLWGDLVLWGRQFVPFLGVGFKLSLCKEDNLVLTLAQKVLILLRNFVSTVPDVADFVIFGAL